MWTRWDGWNLAEARAGLKWSDGMGVSRLSRAFLTGASLLALLGLSLAGCGQRSVGGGASPTATRPPTTCAQVQGFASAAVFSLPSTPFPLGTVARPPIISGGGPGQYSIKTYQACAPNSDINLDVTTGKGPAPFTTLMPIFDWEKWNTFPEGGDAQVACPGVCYTFNVDNASKDLFLGAPGFLSLENVTALGHGLVTFTLREAPPLAMPACDSGFDASDDSVFGHHPEYQTYYDAASGVQYPPLTRAAGNSAPAVIGETLCSAGTAATVKVFMDRQFSSHGYTSVACGSNDCWKNATTTVTMIFTSATQWDISVPRPQL